METLPTPPGPATGQTSPQGGSGGAVLGGPKKPRPAVMRWICPRRSGQSWQENLQNHQNRKQQMTVEQSTDALSLRKGFDGCECVLPRQQSFVAAGQPSWTPGWSGLSRMKGNFHVRFLEGGGPATVRLYSAASVKSDGSGLHGGGEIRITIMIKIGKGADR